MKKPKTKLIQTRVSPALFKFLADGAAKAELSIASYVRQILKTGIAPNG